MGYVWIEGQPFADALYMTVITLTAVGYSEVFELTPTGRTFTMLLLLSGISWIVSFGGHRGLTLCWELCCLMPHPLLSGGPSH